MGGQAPYRFARSTHQENAASILLRTKRDQVDGDDIRVVEGGDGLRLALESFATIGLRGKRCGQHLDRNLSFEPRVGGVVDLAIPPLPSARTIR